MDNYEDDSQQAYESNREREWTADMLNTPWAVEVDRGNMYVVDAAGMRVAEILSPTTQQALLAANKIVELVNNQY